MKRARVLFRLLVAAWLATAAAQSAVSQIATDAAGMRQIGHALVAEGLAADAALIAEALLARDPTDAEALLIAAQSHLLRGDDAAAIATASDAWRQSSGPLAYEAARLAALGHARLGQYTLSQIWLRRARQDAPDAAAVAGVAADYRLVRDRNPLNIQLNFGISPSSNVNSGSATETIMLPGLPFEFILGGEARALSGIQYSAGTSITYRLAHTPNAATFANFQLQGRTYTLSATARDMAPNARGSDFADLHLSLGLTHRWQVAPGTALQTLSGSLGRTWYGGDPYTQFATLSYERDWALTDRQRLALQGFVEWNERLTDNAEFPTYGLRSRWTILDDRANRTMLSLTLREAATDILDLGYQGALVQAQYDFAQPLGGMRLTLGADLEYRDYPGSAFSFDGRQDFRQAIRATVAVPQINFYGFEPTLTLEASRTDSNIPLFEKQDLRMNVGLRSSF
ncbi:MAG: DUF560 domain-containing protein [Rubellimicrobium sp.]|nr:DUF560 domain-containing protein [Rubellimicrobium sp.]